MKKTWIIILALAMMLMVFTVACGEEEPTASNNSDSRQLDVDDDDAEDDVEAARGSNPSGEITFDIDKLGEVLESSGSDDASFRGTARDTSDWASAGGN